MSTIRLRDIRKRYGVGDTAVRALDGVDLDIDAGEFVAIMGASGSGKSTLMNILGCLDVPSSGEYRLDDIDVAGLGERELSLVRRHRVGFVFQSFNLVARTTALANVELPLAYQGVRRAERRARATEALIAVGLEDRMHHEPTQLSGGQQQRVAIARALVTHPSLILADEPTGALDSRSTHELLDLLARVHAGGRTVVLITHEDDVANRARRIIRMRDGRIMDDRQAA